jgi:3-methyladenine DNA glycosylase/8-oxoguanine DNA glycosylase
VDLEALRSRSCEEAREQLRILPGVGRKVADCVLLFAYGFQEAFPIDVWIARALRSLYFNNRKVAPREMLEFSATERWTPLVAEFRRDGFYERFAARGQVERVEKIRDRLRRDSGL